MQRGVIIGARQVLISADGTIGAAAGGAAGGVVGAQVAGSPVTTAFGAIGGALVGGIGGTAAEQAVADTKGWEYIVQETGEKLVSITQTSKTSLPIGLHVLVIADTQQARIVPDYTEQTAPAPASAAAGKRAAVVTATKNTAGPSQATAIPVASAPTVPPAPSPASADQAAAPLAPAPSSGEAATPTAASNQNSVMATPSTGSTANSVQVEPGVSIPIPPVSSSPTAKP